MQDIKIKNLVKYYGDKKVYDGFSLDIRGGEIFSLLGESGSGKTTLLRVLARLTDFSGEVEGIKSAPSFVFQKDLLIPNLTVKENLVFVCPDDRKEEAEKEAERLLEVAKISHLKDRYPKRLSGGECRRVSILRGFIFPSSVMLLDEPFNSLDVKLKYQLIDEVKRLHKEKNNTVIFVTHDIKEAVTLGDRAAVIKDGKIIFLTDLSDADREEKEKEIFKVMTDTE